MTVAVVSAIFGEFDAPKPPAPQTVDCEFVMVTDGPEAEGWDRVLQLGPMPDPRMTAKYPKAEPWLFTPADAWVWIDGAFHVTSSTFVAEAVSSVPPGGIGMWAHPWRDCLYDEAQSSAVLPKYASTPVLHQAAHYRSQGFPAHAGLWAAGLIVYRRPLPELAAAWLAEMRRWGCQDQISLPVALAATQTAITPLPHRYLNWPGLVWYPHRSDL